MHPSPITPFTVGYLCHYNFWARTQKSKSQILAVYGLHLVKRAKFFSICCSTGEYLLRLSKGYYHSKSFSHFLHQLLNLLRIGV